MAGAGQSPVFSAPWSQSRLRKKQGAGAAPKKNQVPEPEPEPQKYAKKIKSIRKLHICYSS